jgi:hypothetical protein
LCLDLIRVIARDSTGTEALYTISTVDSLLALCGFTRDERVLRDLHLLEPALKVLTLFHALLGLTRYVTRIDAFVHSLTRRCCSI